LFSFSTWCRDEARKEGPMPGGLRPVFVVLMLGYFFSVIRAITRSFLSGFRLKVQEYLAELTGIQGGFKNGARA